MKKIPLSNSEEFIIVDDEDFEYLSKFTWRDNKGYVCRQKAINDKNSCIGIANEIFSDRHSMFDHKDRNHLNNQKDNLRKTNTSLNAVNKKKSLYCTSKYKGVSKIYKTGKFRVCIKKDGVVYRLGHFTNEDEAALAYNNKAIELFGEFANLNLINQGI